MTVMRQRRGTAAQWAYANPILGSGEIGVELDTMRYRTGDGNTPWSRLTPTAMPGAGPAQPHAFWNAALAMRNAKAVVLALCGSSTTYGNNATSSANTYVGRLRAMLQTGYPLDSPATPPLLMLADATAGQAMPLGINLVNCGVGGTTSANYLTTATMDKILSLKPQMATHMVGSNDIQQGTALATYDFNLRAKLDYMLANQQAPMVHKYIQSYERFDAGTPVAQWVDYGAVLQQLAVDYPGVVLFEDISWTFPPLGVPGLDPLDLIDTDLVHGRDPNHLLIASMLYEGLRIRPVSPPPIQPPPTMNCHVAPVISGDASQGAGTVLTANNGTWTNAYSGATTTYTYQWRRAGAAIAGATNQTYTLVSADLGVAITVAVTANRAGYVSGTAVSAAVNSSNVSALANTAPPTVSGNTTTGSTLTVTNGTWSGSPTSYTYQWTRDGANIASATASTYVLTAADVGKAITAKVTAVKSGTASVTQAASNYITGGAAPAGDPLAIFTSDNFTGDSANVIGRASTAAAGGTAKTWAGPAGGAAIFQALSGVLQKGASSGAQFVGFQMSSADQALAFKYTQVSDQAIFISLRRTAPATNDAYRIQLIGTTATVQRTAGGTATNLANPNFNVAAGDTIEIRAVGTNITCSVNGTQVYSVTDSTISQAGYAGISTSGSSVFQIDDVLVRSA